MAHIFYLLYIFLRSFAYPSQLLEEYAFFLIFLNYNNVKYLQLDFH